MAADLTRTHSHRDRRLGRPVKEGVFLSKETVPQDATLAVGRTALAVALNAERIDIPLNPRGGAFLAKGPKSDSAAEKQ